MFLVAKCRTVNSTISTKNENCTFSRAAFYLRGGLSSSGVPAQRKIPALCQLYSEDMADTKTQSSRAPTRLIPFKFYLKELSSDFFK